MSSSSSPSSAPKSMSNDSSSSRSSSSRLTISRTKPISWASISSVASETDWVAVTISPRLNITETRAAGLALIFSAKSISEAPRDSRTVVPLPRGSITPPTDGACIDSYS